MTKTQYKKPLLVKIPPDASTVQIDSPELAEQLRKKLSTVSSIRTAEQPKLSNGTVVAIKVRLWSDAETEKARRDALLKADAVIGRFIKRVDQNHA